MPASNKFPVMRVGAFAGAIFIAACAWFYTTDETDTPSADTRASSTPQTHSAPGAKRAQPTLTVELTPDDALPSSLYDTTASMQAMFYDGFEADDPTRLRFIEGDDRANATIIEIEDSKPLTAPFLTNQTVIVTDVDETSRTIRFDYTPDY